MAVVRGLITRLAIRWLYSEWMEWMVDGPPERWEVPWIDASKHPSIIMAPGVIHPPGLMIDFDPPAQDTGPIQALGTWGMKGGESHLLGHSIHDGRTDKQRAESKPMPRRWRELSGYELAMVMLNWRHTWKVRVFSIPPIAGWTFMVLRMDLGGDQLPDEVEAKVDEAANALTVAMQMKPEEAKA